MSDFIHIENFDKYELIHGIQKPVALKIIFKNIEKELLAEYIIKYCSTHNIFKVLNNCFECYELQTFIYNNNNITDAYLLSTTYETIDDEKENIKISKFNRLKFCTKIQKTKCIFFIKHNILIEEIKKFIIDCTTTSKFEKMFEKIFKTSQLKTILMMNYISDDDYKLLYNTLVTSKNKLNITSEQDYSMFDCEDNLEDDAILNEFIETKKKILKMI